MNERGIAAVERLKATRPDPDDLYAYRRRLDRPIEITPDNGVTWRVGPVWREKPDQVLYLAEYTSEYEGTFVVILRVRPGPRRDDKDGEGWCELGTVVDSYEYYMHGADLLALHDAGARLSWAAAQWVHAAAGHVLATEYHAPDKVHGALTPRRIRLGFYRAPYTARSHEEAAPFVFVRAAIATGTARFGPKHEALAGDDAQRATERAVLARTIALLTRHPDPTIDRLLRDPEAATVLRDLLLERGAPIDGLVRDCANVPELPLVPLADDPAIDDELVMLWHAVLRLDPMIDTTDPAIFELRGP